MWKITSKVVKRCRNIFCRVSISGVADDEAGLAHCSVSNQDAVYLALRCGAGPPALHVQREIPVLHAPIRNRRTIASAHRVRHTAGLLLPYILREHDSTQDLTITVLLLLYGLTVQSCWTLPVLSIFLTTLVFFLLLFWLLNSTLKLQKIFRCVSCEPWQRFEARSGTAVGFLRSAGAPDWHSPYICCGRDS